MGQLARNARVPVEGGAAGLVSLVKCRGAGEAWCGRGEVLLWALVWWVAPGGYRGAAGLTKRHGVSDCWTAACGFGALTGRLG